MLISNIVKNISIAICSGAFVWILASYINVLQGQTHGGTDAAWNFFVILLKLGGVY